MKGSEAKNITERVKKGEGRVFLEIKELEGEIFFVEVNRPAKSTIFTCMNKRMVPGLMGDRSNSMHSYIS